MVNTAKNFFDDAKQPVAMRATKLLQKKQKFKKQNQLVIWLVIKLQIKLKAEDIKFDDLAGKSIETKIWVEINDNACRP